MPLGLVASVGIFVGGVSFGFAGFAFALFATSALALDAPPHVVVPAVMLVGDTLALPLLWEYPLYVRTVLIAVAGYVRGILLRRLLRSERAFRAVVLVLLTAYAVALIARGAVP